MLRIEVQILGNYDNNKVLKITYVYWGSYDG